MSFIRKFQRKGRVYLAEVENQRVDGKVKQKFIRYIGTEPSDKKSVFPSSHSDLSVESVRLYGTVIVMDFIAKQLEFDKLLGKYYREILTLVYCHCHHYKSVLDVKRWFKKTDLHAIFGVDNFNEKQMDRAISALNDMDVINLQKSIFENLKTICPEKNNLSVIYDVTNTYFYGKNCHLAEFGKDKEGVKGRKIIQIGLALTKEAKLPIFHQVHPGNISDCKLFGEAIILLHQFGISHGTIVYDRGMNAKSSILQLVKDGWHLIGGMPLHKGIKHIISNIPINKIECYRNRMEQGGTIFYVKSLPHSIKSVKGKLFIVVNSQKKYHEKEKRLKKIQQYQKARHPIEQCDKKYFTANGHVNHHAIRRAEKYDGMSIIFSTGRESRQDILQLYFEKDVIEKSFHTLKSVLALRPIRHWLDEKVKAHVMICYLSYALLTTFRYLLKNNELGLGGISVETALSELENIYKIYYRNNKAKGSDNPLFSKIITLSSLQEKILTAVSPNLLV